MNKRNMAGQLGNTIANKVHLAIQAFGPTLSSMRSMSPRHIVLSQLRGWMRVTGTKAKTGVGRLLCVLTHVPFTVAELSKSGQMNLARVTREMLNTNDIPYIRGCTPR